MIAPFIYTVAPARVRFGCGALSVLGEEIERLGCSRPLFLATPAQAAEVRALAARFGQPEQAVFANAAMHTPTGVSDAAARYARDLKADCTVAFGGGSTIGLGKAIALRTNLPQICIPTTYAGSEMTPILGQTENGVKTTQSGPEIRPEVVIYDVDLTLSLPVALSCASGLNAIAHAVEALYAVDGNPVISLMAEAGIAALARALPAVAAGPGDSDARSDALYGAWLCGACLGAVSMALHHKLAHVLGGSFALPHAESHAVLLPHSVAYNTPAAPEAMERVARALGVRSAAAGLYDLTRQLNIETSLRGLGMPEAGINRAASQAVANPYANPRPVTEDGMRSLLRRAWAGLPPDGLAGCEPIKRGHNELYG